MKYVVDANVYLKAVLSESDSDKAKRLVDEYRAGTHELLAPAFFPYELGNGLTRTERKRVIQQGEAGILLAKLLADGPVLHEPNLTRAIDIASRTWTSLWDCLYLVLSEEHGCPFVTADRKILNALPQGNVVGLHTL
jgi:predicted nucleic acid-binding protein